MRVAARLRLQCDKKCATPRRNSGTSRVFLSFATLTGLASSATSQCFRCRPPVTMVLAGQCATEQKFRRSEGRPGVDQRICAGRPPLNPSAGKSSAIAQLPTSSVQLISTTPADADWRGRTFVATSFETRMGNTSTRSKTSVHSHSRSTLNRRRRRIQITVRWLGAGDSCK